MTDGEDGTLVTVEDAVGDVDTTGVTDTLPVNDCAADGDTEVLNRGASDVEEILEAEDDIEYDELREADGENVCVEDVV